MENTRQQHYDKSITYRHLVHQFIPGGAHTYSKGDDQFPEMAPAAIARGLGAYVWDIDGNKFLDCPMGLTSVGLGHAYKPVLDRVKEELDKGVNFQRPGAIELEMAQAFLKLIPAHDMIKFAKNGSTVTTAATKLARAYTGRSMIAFPATHPFYSYDDWFIGKTACDLGVPQQVQSLSVTFDPTNLQTLEDLFKKYPDQIACVISEPTRSIATAEFDLREIIELTHRYGALFIQDEMITGYKVDFPGAMTKYQVQPDLATWGKGIANGFSFCALTGKREIMEQGGIKRDGAPKLFLISTTHGGETHAIAAALATLDEYKTKNVIAHNHQIGKDLIDKCQAIVLKLKLQDMVQIIPCPWLVGFAFQDEKGQASSPLRTLAMQEMIKRGVLFQGTFVPCFSHTLADVQFFAQAFEESLEVYQKALKEGVEKYLIGLPARPVFRKYL